MQRIDRTVWNCVVFLAMSPLLCAAEIRQAKAVSVSLNLLEYIEQDPTRKAGTFWNGNGLKMPFRWCPAGTFLFGSPDLQVKFAGGKQTTVTHPRGYWLGEYEVTQAEWSQVMGSTIDDQHKKIKPRFERTSPFAGDPKKRVVDDPTSFGKGDRHPMYYVDWDEAMQFCQKLTEIERAADRLPPNWEYTLPTEAQWEYACRAGTTTRSAFGDMLSSHQANFNGRHPYTNRDDEDIVERAPEGPYRRKSIPVGRFKPNAWGLHDMHGNVEEWCRDWYEEKRLPEGEDPEILKETLSKVARGGDWFSSGYTTLSGHRWYNLRIERRTHTGFRVALRQLR